MNKFYKKLSIIFVTVFTIMLGSFTNVLAADSNVNWKTYDDDNTIFTYENLNDWHNGDTRNFLNGGGHVTTDRSKKSSVKFNFIGTKFILKNQCYIGGRNKNINVYIDDKLYNFSAPQQLIDGHAKYYESPELTLGEHSVSIEKAEPYNDGHIFFDIVDIDGELKPYNPSINEKKFILNVEPERNNIHLNESVTANLTIDNIKEIAAEDVRIKYDNTKLKFLGIDEIDRIKLVKLDGKDGELRFILASKGADNVVNAKKALLKLKFQGIAKGEALVDVVKGRVSDGITMENDLTDDQCGQATIIIDDTVIKDVNNSGEFTLLDLAIDARHLGQDPKTLAQYNTDIVENNAIDDDDLLKIGEYMLANSNYKF